MYYIVDKTEVKNLRRIATGKLKLPNLGFYIEVGVADAARAECRYCRNKIRKGEKKIKIVYAEGDYSTGYQVHLLDKECIIDPRIERKLNVHNSR